MGGPIDIRELPPHSSKISRVWRFKLASQGKACVNVSPGSTVDKNPGWGGGGGGGEGQQTLDLLCKNMCKNCAKTAAKINYAMVLNTCIGKV